MIQLELIQWGTFQIHLTRITLINYDTIRIYNSMRNFPDTFNAY